MGETLHDSEELGKMCEKQLCDTRSQRGGGDPGMGAEISMQLGKETSDEQMDYAATCGGLTFDQS